MYVYSIYKCPHIRTVSYISSNDSASYVNTVLYGIFLLDFHVLESCKRQFFVIVDLIESV